MHSHATSSLLPRSWTKGSWNYSCTFAALALRSRGIR